MVIMVIMVIVVTAVSRGDEGRQTESDCLGRAHYPGDTSWVKRERESDTLANR
jgi:hypothetical protein